jgi:hypothetical protein
MSFTIDDKVILTFSPERLENDLFQAADGLVATVTERYSQSHLPDIHFYEVELDEPIEENGRRIVVISGLLDKDLQPASLAEKINPKYLTRNAKAMKDEIRKHAHKDEDDPSAYTSHPKGDWKADYDKSGKKYKTKTSSHTKKFKEMFGESAQAINESDVDKALTNKSKKTGISTGILKKVYNRGLAAWRTGHRPGVGQHQWAMARVNSFATKGKGTWGKADKDLAKKVRAVNEEYDQSTDMYSLTLSRREVDCYMSTDEIVWPKQVWDEIKRRYPDWNREEESQLTELGLLSDRFSIEEIDYDDAKVWYTVEPLFDSNGLEGVDVTLTRVYFVLSFMIWDKEADDTGLTVEVEFEIEPTQPEVSIGTFPIMPTNLEINVPNTLEHKDFRFKLQMGE